MTAPSTPQMLYSQAVTLYRAGRLNEAEALCRQVLAQDPNNAGCLQMLGILAHRAGNTKQAIDLLRKATALSPTAAEFHSNLGAMLASAGQWPGAMNAFDRAVELRPDLPEAHANLGKALHEVAQFDRAIQEIQRAIALRRDYPEAFNLLGAALQAKGLLEDADAAYRRAIASRPDFVEAVSNLGGVLQLLSRSAEAIVLLEQALALRPDFYDALMNLGNSLHSLGRFEDAAVAYRRAIAVRPDAAEAHVNLGIALLELGRIDESITACDEGLRLRSTFADGWYNLGNALRRAGQLDDAAAAYRRSIALRPDFGDAIANLGNTLRDSGRLDEAIACYRKAIPLTKGAWPSGSLLYSLYFHPAYDARPILKEHRQWNDACARPFIKPTPPYANDRNPDRRLRIGYVSPDFRNHCQANFTIPLLSNHDHARFEIVCYSSVSLPDETTARIRGHADLWREIGSINDSQAADLIRQDRIDILVDLTMHMDKNRLMIFARKPAPVQISWLAYPGTTGLETIEYRLSDPHLDPLSTSSGQAHSTSSGQVTCEHDDAYSEKTIRLPQTFWCYDPLTDLPQVNALPAKANGYLTFGCLNNFCKITGVTLDLWSSVMKRLPNSHLIVLTPRGSARENLLAALQSRGVDPSRIEPIDRLSRLAYLSAYNRFDLCLDTFPYNGHTTTLDSLWMGVPPITMSGETAVSRGGLSLLSNVGLEDFVAQTPEQFTEIAVRVAADLPSLAELRSKLRQRMETSPLMDAPRFARNIESAFRAIWRTWCVELGEC